jgi:hypothetical protein
MRMSVHVEGVVTDLAAVADGDPTAEPLAERLIRLVEPSVRMRLFDALGEAARELNAQLPTGHVEVRLDGRDATLTFVDGSGSAAEDRVEDDLTARITLRLPERLKGDAESAAGREGLSMNAWLVRAVRGALDRRPPGGRRLTGYARS